MSFQEKVFVVVNPTLDKQVALDRALIHIATHDPSSRNLRLCCGGQ
jgi:hypothetical protein